MILLSVTLDKIFIEKYVWFTPLEYFIWKSFSPKICRNHNYFCRICENHCLPIYRLNKSYEALEYGFEADAFTDLTGGLAEWYNPAELKEHDFYLIRAAYQCGAVIGCLSVVSFI